MVNRVGERILPCGTPSSYGFSEEWVLSKRTLYFLPFKKLSMNKDDVGEATVPAEAGQRRQGNGPIYQDEHGRNDLFPGIRRLSLS